MIGCIRSYLIALPLFLSKMLLFFPLKNLLVALLFFFAVDVLCDIIHFSNWIVGKIKIV